MATYTSDNKSCWYSTNSLVSFRRHESRRKVKMGGEASAAEQVNEDREKINDDVKIVSIPELTQLRVEGTKLSRLC